LTDIKLERILSRNHLKTVWNLDLQKLKCDPDVVMMMMW